ncbi:MAG: hypothetical protein H0U60_19990 [Blastocatellia bacterium]|nr:hypothetical protein [Blastocatellia bacterium]
MNTFNHIMEVLRLRDKGLTLLEIAEKTGVNYTTARYRLNTGEKWEEAMLRRNNQPLTVKYKDRLKKKMEENK